MLCKVPGRIPAKIPGKITLGKASLAKVLAKYLANVSGKALAESLAKVLGKYLAKVSAKAFIH